MRPLAILPLLALSGCIRIMGGVEAGAPASGRPAYATATVDYGPFTQDFGFGLTSRVRGGPGGAELGAGAFGCWSSATWIQADLCGRMFALELGARQGSFTFGGLSPGIGASLWFPDPRPPALLPSFNRRNDGAIVQATVVSLWLGYDVRATPWKHSSPYLGLQVGRGNREVPGYSVPSHLRRTE